ncbi:MAG TPA: sulfatase-like hydrolase/transferase [Caulobacteraceae bacterium]|nr:sulfatase-like hydrolase/transferase [Caulobacteraceae bacterium]
MAAAPRNAIVILLDSLNRHMLGAYGGTEFETPNLDRFARGAVRFTGHHTGSLPCMPARHDILCGALDFLWKAWGSVEIWEDAITHALRRAKVTTQLVSDHPHLFETGGENYHADFTAWDYQRGHEGDAWKTRSDPSWAGAPSFGRGWMPYDSSRGWFRGEADFPGPRTMAAAARWVEENAGQHERFFLFVDEFDPHEPFDTPEPWASKYDPDWRGPHLIWPPYAVGAQARGIIDARQGRQIRSQYGAKLSMIDHWLGKLMDAVEARGLFEDTLVMVVTDHGHYLGEKDCWGKPGCPIYAPLGHIPLLIRAPGVAAGTCAALTTAVDIFATLADIFDVQVRQRTHGRSLMPLLRREADQVRDWLVTGVWGREVVLVTAQHKYVRGPAGANAPLSMLSNRWSTMPTHGALDARAALPAPDARAFLDRMPGSDVPVIHQTWGEGERAPFWSWFRPTGNYVFDRADDPDETRNLIGGPLEARLAEQLRAALVELEAPKTQLQRLGL